jgi:hypothetical protein
MPKKKNHNPPPDPTPPPAAAPQGGVTKTIRDPLGQSNPFYGCAILVIVLSTFGFIVSWILYSGLKQSSEIGAFTSPDPPALEAITVDDGQKAAMKSKLEGFAMMANAGKPVTLILTPEELNAVLVLAAEGGVADYLGMVRFTGMDAAAQVLKADIRWKMNNLPFVKAPDRFLAGHATFQPVIENGALELHITGLDVPGKTVSEGFMKQLGNWPWLNLAKLREDVKTPLTKVTSFEFTPDNGLFILQAGEAEKK